MNVGYEFKIVEAMESSKIETQLAEHSKAGWEVNGYSGFVTMRGFSVLLRKPIEADDGLLNDYSEMIQAS